MSNKKDKYKINYSTYVSGGRAMGNSGSAIRGGLSSAFSRVKSTSNKENTSSKKSSSGGVSGSVKSSVGSTVTSNKSSNSYDSSSKNNTNLDYNVKKYMGQRGGTFGDKSYTKIGDDFYLKANPYSGIDMKKNNKPKLLKENQYNISEENREKINKGKIESYIKGINPYSAPPKNIRDAKAKESVESFMNSIQKRKNNVFKNQSEDNERGITDKGISQVTSNIKPYGMDQRSAVNTKNNSLYQAYPGYGSRVTSEDIQRINYNANNFVKQRDEKAVLRKQMQANKEKVSNTVNSVMSNYYKPYNEANNVKINGGYPAYGSMVTNEDIQRINANSKAFVDRNKSDFQAGQAIKAQKEAAKKAEQEKKANAKPIENVSDVSKYVMDNYYKPYNEANHVNINTGYPSNGSRVTNADIQKINANTQTFVNRNKADFLAGQVLKAQKEAEKKAAQEKKANAKPVDNLSDVANYYYVQNGNFDKDKFNQQMTDYKSYLTEKENLKKQNKTKEAEELEKQNEANVNDLLYSNNSVPGQPTSGNFTQEHLGKAVPEYKDLTTKENEAVSIEQEYSSDLDREKYIKAGENTASDNTNAGYRYDTNPLKAYRDDSWYLKRDIDQDTRYKKGLDYMNQEEIDTANYILGKYGPKAQTEYLENIAFRMEERRAKEVYNRLENSGPLQKGWHALANGFMSKGKDTIQGIVNMGANKNSFTPSGYEMAVDKARDNASGFEKLYLNGLNDLDEYSFDYIVNPFNKVKKGKTILTKGASIARKLDYANEGKKAEKVINTLKKVDNDIISFEDMYNITGNTFHVSAKGKKKAEREAFNNGEVISKDKAISEGKKYAGTDLVASIITKGGEYPVKKVIKKSKLDDIVKSLNLNKNVEKELKDLTKDKLNNIVKDKLKKSMLYKYSDPDIHYKKDKDVDIK